MSPKQPVIFPWKVEPRDSAASSMSGTPLLSQISRIRPIWAGVPYRWAQITAFAFGYFSKAASSASGSMFQVCSSASMNTGTAFS